ncbi:MAG: GNAT family N-acetyltransferase [Candidatus Dormiibacterota bacterium]
MPTSESKRAEDQAEFRSAFDAQMRGPLAMKMPEGGDEEMDGPICRSWGWSPRGFVMTSDLSGLDGAQLDALIERQVGFFAGRREAFEWKTYSHDQTADLVGRLVQAGFLPEERESLVIGRVGDIDLTAQAPPGVTLREVHSRNDTDRMAELLTLVDSDDRSFLSEAFFKAAAANPGDVVLLVAETDGQVVSTARVNLVPGNQFATLWAGSTHPDWRHQGIYRATVAYRGRLAAKRGRRYLQVDATEASRPILERLGFLTVATTTPYIWSPPS